MTSEWQTELKEMMKKLNKPYIWTCYILFCLGCEIGLAYLGKLDIAHAVLPPMIAAAPLLIWSKIALSKKQSEEKKSCYDEFTELMKYADTIAQKWGKTKIVSRIENPEFNAEKDNLRANIEELYVRRKCNLEAIDRIFKQTENHDISNSGYRNWGNILNAIKQSLSAMRDDICPKLDTEKGDKDA